MKSTLARRKQKPRLCHHAAIDDPRRSVLESARTQSNMKNTDAGA